jgi:hypothetical protein
MGRGKSPIHLNSYVSLPCIQVMLLRNLASHLVNGSIGIVKKIAEDFILVAFEKISSHISRCHFSCTFLYMLFPILDI